MQKLIEKQINLITVPIVSKQKSFDIVLDDGTIQTYDKPFFNITTSLYYFELWVNNQYSCLKKLNNDYKDDILATYLAGWNDCSDETYNNGIIFNGDLKYCKEEFEKIAKEQLEAFELLKQKGFDNLFYFTYKDPLLSAIFQGFKIKFTFMSLLYLISKKENIIFSLVNMETATNIEKIWMELIKDKRLKLVKVKFNHVF